MTIALLFFKQKKELIKKEKNHPSEPSYQTYILWIINELKMLNLSKIKGMPITLIVGYLNLRNAPKVYKMSEKDLFHGPYFVFFLLKVQTGVFIGNKDEKWQNGYLINY